MMQESEIIKRFNQDNPRILCDDEIFSTHKFLTCKATRKGNNIARLEPTNNEKSSVLSELLSLMPQSERKEALEVQAKAAKLSQAEYSLFSGTMQEVMNKTIECIYNDEKGLGLTKESSLYCTTGDYGIGINIKKMGNHHIFRISDDEYLYVSHRYIW